MTDFIKDRKGGVGVVFIVIGVIIALLIIAGGGVFGYFWNATPEKVGIADKELFNGQSFETLGLADVKFKDIIKQFKAIKNADTSNIVENAPTDADKTEAETNTSNVSNENFVKDGKNDYSIIISEELKYDNHYKIDYEDTTLCYVFNEILNGNIDGNSDLELLSKINATIDEITIKAGAEKEVRIVMSIDVAPFRDKLKETLGDAYSLLKGLIPERLYVVSTFGIDADSEGKIIMTSKNFVLNNTENAVTKALFGIIASFAGEDNNKTEEEQKALLNEKIGDAFEAVVFNLGFVGKVEDGAYLVNNGLINDMSKVTYCADGIQNGKLTLITRAND